jgi:hypothetical protein
MMPVGAAGVGFGGGAGGGLTVWHHRSGHKNQFGHPLEAEYHNYILATWRANKSASAQSGIRHRDSLSFYLFSPTGEKRHDYPTSLPIGDEIRYVFD